MRSLVVREQLGWLGAKSNRIATGGRKVRTGSCTHALTHTHARPGPNHLPRRVSGCPGHFPAVQSSPGAAGTRGGDSCWRRGCAHSHAGMGSSVSRFPTGRILRPALPCAGSGHRSWRHRCVGAVPVHLPSGGPSTAPCAATGVHTTSRCHALWMCSTLGVHSPGFLGWGSKLAVRVRVQGMPARCSRICDRASCAVWRSCTSTRSWAPRSTRRVRGC